MQIFIEQFYTAAAWISALGLGTFSIWLFACAVERWQKRARKGMFFKPKPGDNPVYDFLQDWCDRTSGAKIYAGDLYDAYRVWCSDNEEEALGRHIFGRHLSEMKLEREKHQWIVYLNIELNSKAKRRMAAENRTSR